MLVPNIRRRFKGNPAGAVVSEFSAHSYDERDILTDPSIRRETLVA